MKKFIFFLISFMILFSLLTFLSGMFLTSAYTPDIDEAWKMSAALPSQIEIYSSGGSFLLTLLLGLLSAASAYLVTNRFIKLHS